MTILMIVSNPCTSDARVEREAKTLVAAGHAVTIVAAGGGELAEREERGGFLIQRVNAESRLEQALPSLLKRAHGLLPGRRASTESPEDGSGSSRGGEGVLEERVWLAATEAEGRSLILRNPRAAVLRVALRLFKALRWLRFARSSWRVLSRQPAATYIAHDLDTLPIAWRAKRRFRVPLIYDSHELYMDQFINPPRIWRLRWALVERFLIRRVDGVITVSDSIADVLRDRYAIPRPAVVRNIPDLPEPAATKDGTRGLRETLEIPDDRRVALYVGAIEHGRRLEHFVETAALLDDEVTVVLMGPSDPGYQRALERQARDLGAGERFRVAPPVPPDLVAATAAEADVGLLVFQPESLNYNYALPSKLFQSLQAGIPVVASASYTEITRIVQHYKVGVVCPSNDAPTLASVIKDVFASGADYERMRANTRQAASELSWKHESERLLGVLMAVGPKA